MDKQAQAQFINTERDRDELLNTLRDCAEDLNQEEIDNIIYKLKRANIVLKKLKYVLGK